MGLLLELAEVALVLRVARTARGLKQRDIAMVLGICQGTYSNWERGERPVPRKHLEPLAAALRIPAEDLVVRPRHKRAA